MSDIKTEIKSEMETEQRVSTVSVDERTSREKLLEAALIELNAKLTATEGLNKSLKKQINHLAESIDSKTQEVKRLKKAVRRNPNADVNRAMKERRQLETAVRDLKSEMDGLRQQLLSLSDENFDNRLVLGNCNNAKLLLIVVLRGYQAKKIQFQKIW